MVEMRAAEIQRQCTREDQRFILIPHGWGSDNYYRRDQRKIYQVWRDQSEFLFRETQHLLYQYIFSESEKNIGID